MAQPYKRTRTKTGPNTYRTVTFKRDGTSHTSYSTKTGNKKTGTRTRTISNKGWTFTSTDGGWVRTEKSKKPRKPRSTTTKQSTFKFKTPRKRRSTKTSSYSKISYTPTTSSGNYSSSSTYSSSSDDSIFVISRGILVLFSIFVLPFMIPFWVYFIMMCWLIWFFWLR